MAKTLGVSRQGYYHFIKRPFSRRAFENQKISEEIKLIFKESYDTYCSPRIHAELKARGWTLSRVRVARLMNKLGLSAKMWKRFKKTTRQSIKQVIQPQDLVDQNFQVTEPNKIWVADFTFIKINKKWCYLAVILDLFSRKIIGMSLQERMTVDLVLKATLQALTFRKPARGLIHHSDLGSQYTSYDLRSLAKAHGILMSYAQCVYDNSVMESFFHTLKTEWIYFKNYQTLEEAKLDIFTYIFTFYNTKRRHSTLNYQTPQTIENNYFKKYNVYV